MGKTGETVDWVEPLFGIGILGLAACALMGVEELISAARIKPAPPLPFSLVRLEEEQFRTIIAPAIAALTSGLLVSLSASHLYSASLKETSTAESITGIGFFLAAAIALVVTLKLALGKNRKVLEHVRAPHHIKAAAEAASESPRHPPLPHDELCTRLAVRESSAAAHAMGVARDIPAARLLAAMEHSRTASRNRVWSSLRIYGAALIRFPWPFALPVAVLVVYLVGLWIVAVQVGLASWRMVAIAIAFTVLGLLCTAFYAFARGNRARRKYSVEIEEISSARGAIDDARLAHEALLAEDATRATLQERLVALLEHSESARRSASASREAETDERETSPLALTIWRWRIEIGPRGR